MRTVPVSSTSATQGVCVCVLAFAPDSLHALHLFGTTGTLPVIRPWPMMLSQVPRIKLVKLLQLNICMCRGVSAGGGGSSLDHHLHFGWWNTYGVWEDFVREGGT
jgi:hypothetical protein